MGGEFVSKLLMMTATYRVRWFDIGHAEFTESLPQYAVAQTDLDYSPNGTAVRKNYIMLTSPINGETQLALVESQ